MMYGVDDVQNVTQFYCTLERVLGGVCVMNDGEFLTTWKDIAKSLRRIAAALEYIEGKLQ